MKIFRLFVAFILGCFALSPAAYGVVPPPDGGYPGFTTAEGTNALQNLTTGVGNTATGWHSLFANTAGNLNTGVGAGTLIGAGIGTEESEDALEIQASEIPTQVEAFSLAGFPIVTTFPAALITSFSARLNGSLNPNGLPTTFFFQYGRTTNYG